MTGDQRLRSPGQELKVVAHYAVLRHQSRYRTAPGFPVNLLEILVFRTGPAT